MKIDEVTAKLTSVGLVMEEFAPPVRRVKFTPSVEGVYLLFQGEELLYVGTTTNLASRLKGHHIYRPGVTVMVVQKWPPRFGGIQSDRYRMEWWMIGKLSPPCNIAGTSRRVRLVGENRKQRIEENRGKTMEQRNVEYYQRRDAIISEALRQLPHPQTSPEEVK